MPRKGQDAGWAERLEGFFKPSASGGPTVKGVLVGRGPNRAVSTNDLSKVLTEDQIAFLVDRTGMSTS